MRYLVLLSITFISACAGVGYIATSDPSKKISQAYSLMNEDRLLLAEDMIGQALAISQEQGDEAGIAEAYHTYGNLYKSSEYIDGRWTGNFKSLGTYDGTFQKSIDYFSKCAEIYEKLGEGSGAAKCLMGVGNGYSGRGDHVNACKYYRSALARYQLAKQTEVNFVEPQMRANYANMGELIEAFIEYEPCAT